MVSIRTTIPLNSIDWGRVCLVLCKHRGYTRNSAEQVSAQFAIKFGTLLNPQVFLRNELSNDENNVAAAISEISGSDDVVVNQSLQLTIASFRVALSQLCTFSPQLRSSNVRRQRGECAPKVAIAIGSATVELTTFWSILLLDLCAVVLLALSYVIAFGGLLYGLSVFLVFLEIPGIVTKVALNKWSVGLALLIFLIALAGISGRAARNIINLARLKRS